MTRGAFEKMCFGETTLPTLFDYANPTDELRFELFRKELDRAMYNLVVFGDTAGPLPPETFDVTVANLRDLWHPMFDVGSSLGAGDLVGVVERVDFKSGVVTLRKRQA